MAGSPTHNIVRIRVEFAAGEPPPRLARIGLLDNRVHRVVNPRRQHVATFHDLPAGPTRAIVTVNGRPVGRTQLIIPATGEVEATVRVDGDPDDGLPYHGGFRVLDEHTGEPLRGRKYRITSASGISVTGETDDHGYTRRVGSSELEDLHLELLDDDDNLNDLHPDDDLDDDPQNDDTDDDDTSDPDADDEADPTADERGDD